MQSASEQTETPKPSRFLAWLKRLPSPLLSTWWGPVVGWWTAALVWMAVLVVEPVLGGFGSILENMTGVVLLLATLAAVVIWFVALGKKRWGRAAAQFVIGILSFPVFCVGGFASMVTGNALGLHVRPQALARAAIVKGTGIEIPFSVEFTPSHPFLAEYDRGIVFRSGKRIGIWPDTGGGGPFAVYRLPSGAFYLVCGMNFEPQRNEYRIDPAAETVELLVEGRWISIPDGTKAVVGQSKSVTGTISTFGLDIETETASEQYVRMDGVPVGDSLEGRTYLGLVKPDGSFEPGVIDPSPMPPESAE